VMKRRLERKGLADLAHEGCLKALSAADPSRTSWMKQPEAECFRNNGGQQLSRFQPAIAVMPK
jgi:hypothetical protein